MILADAALPTLLYGLGAAVVAAFVSGFSVYFQQKNRRDDKLDSAALGSATARVADTAAALDAWQKIVAANNLQLVAQAAELKTQRERNDACELRAASFESELVQMRAEMMIIRAGQEPPAGGLVTS